MDQTKPKIAIIGGGTFSYVRAHLALATPAFGETANRLLEIFHNLDVDKEYSYDLYLTKMADPQSYLVTNVDISQLVDELIKDPDVKIIVFNAALTDFNGTVDGVEGSKYGPRLQSRLPGQSIELHTADKIIGKIRKQRKDIFLVGFKTTTGATPDEQYIAGLNLLKENSCNLVLANDIETRMNMVIVPEEARYAVTNNRQDALQQLVKMTMARSKCHFTRSTVIDGETVAWNDPLVPESLRVVVDYCRENGAYKPFRGATAGHFAVKVDDTTFLTSKRKTNFNDLDKVGLVKVISSGPDEVIAYGSKPSVGGQSQRIIFNEHQDVDCIVHFHCPIKPDSQMARAPQWQNECGSHECGKNTSDHLQLETEGIKAVFLEEHGPNIVFNRNIDPNLVINFINNNFDLSQKTGGLV